MGRQLRHGLVALIVAQNSVAGIRKPDVPVRMHHHVVGCVESLALIGVHQNGDASIVLGAGHPSRCVLTGDQPALPVARVAVAVVGWAAKDADRSGFLGPAQHAVVGDITPDEIAAIAKPDRPLGPARACVESLQGRAAKHVFAEGRLDSLNSRVRIADDAAFPVSIQMSVHVVPQLSADCGKDQPGGSRQFAN